MSIKIGDKIKYLTVLERDVELTKQYHRSYWKCQCECGNIKSLRGDYLLTERATSCGCLLGKIDHSGGNLSGQRFSKLTVCNINFPISKEKGRIYYDCKCDCGNTITTRGSQLKDGGIKSCGCILSFKELEIISILNKLNINYKKEYSFPNLNGTGNMPLRFDFAIFDIHNNLLFLIEYQGIQHFDKLNDYHTKSLEEHDKKKKEYCQLNNIPLYELTKNDNLEERLHEILNGYQL